MSERQTVRQVARELGLSVRMPGSMTWEWARGLECRRVDDNEWELDDLTGAWRMVRIQNELVIEPARPPQQQQTAGEWVLWSVVTIMVAGMIAYCVLQLAQLVKWAVGR